MSRMYGRHLSVTRDVFTPAARCADRLGNLDRLSSAQLTASRHSIQLRQFLHGDPGSARDRSECVAASHLIRRNLNAIAAPITIDDVVGGNSNLSHSLFFRQRGIRYIKLLFQALRNLDGVSLTRGRGPSAELSIQILN